MKYIDADQIRAEIERQVTHTMQCMGGKITGEPVLSARKLLSFLDTLEADALEGLAEAAEKYRRNSCNAAMMPNIDGPMPEYGGSVKDAFKAGAEWMKAKMLEEAVDGVVMDFSSNLPRPQVDILLDPGKYHTGDKVRVIVIKED